MIFGIGTDIVKVVRIQAIYDKFGEKFPRRILTKRELDMLQKSRKPVHFLAKRFAAKEAAAKAMGVGFRDGLVLADIGVVQDAVGKPMLEFSGRAKQLNDRNSIKASQLSLADEDEYAIAFVMLEI
ncbi:MAG: holo-ACP synthase [Gammaproteobacteria bacterium]